MAPESKGQCVSWHCSEALEAEYSAACFLDGKPSALSRLTRTAAKSSCAAKTKVTSRRFPYGTTSAPLTERDGEVLLMWYRLAFLASRSLSPASGGGRTMSAICGPRPSEYYAKYDRDTRSLKTCQASLFPDISTGSWLTFTKAGLMRDGCVYPQPKLERRTGEIGSGLRQSPDAAGGGRTTKGSKRPSEGGLASQVKNNKWPTPKSSPSGPDFARATREGSGADDLATAVARGGTKTRRMIPTPTSKQNQHCPSMQKQGVACRNAKEMGLTGQLNPDWVEWLMGWPIGWTDCEHLATDRFQQWLEQRGNS